MVIKQKKNLLTSLRYVNRLQKEEQKKYTRRAKSHNPKTNKLSKTLTGMKAKRNCVYIDI